MTCVCANAHGSVSVDAGVPMEARGVCQTLLELELQAGVNHLMWVLGTELRSSIRAASAPTTIEQSPSPAPSSLVF